MFSIILIPLIAIVQAQAEDDEQAIQTLFDQIKDAQTEKAGNPFMKILQPLFDQLEKQEQGKENTDAKQNVTDKQPFVLDTEKLVEEIRKYQNQTLKKWNKEMINFQPDDLMTFELDSSEVLTEEVLKPTLLRGAFFTRHFSNNKIKLTIKSPQNQTLYKKELNEDVFELELEEAGEYSFIFNNKNKDKILVTFAVDVHQSHKDFLEIRDLEPVDQRVEAIHIALRDQYFYAKLGSSQYNQQQETLKNAEDKLLIYFMIEALGIILISLWQVFYLKRILSSERII